VDDCESIYCYESGLSTHEVMSLCPLSAPVGGVFVVTRIDYYTLYGNRVFPASHTGISHEISEELYSQKNFSFR
jgi:hypothetical protein